MKALGLFGIAAGVMMSAVGGVCWFYVGPIALTPLLVGIIAILCGAICIGLDTILDRLRRLESQVAELNLAHRKQTPSPGEVAARQTVAELHREGLIHDQSSVGETEIPELLE